MHIDQIRYFLEIEKHKSFSTASEELCISQSSLSKQIKSLENELEIVLFNRSNKSISLTTAGNHFLVHANNLLNTHNKIIKDMKDFVYAEESTLSIGAIPLMAQYGIISLISSFNRYFPNINIDIIEKDDDELLTSINSSKIDLAFVHSTSIDETLYNLIPLFKDQLVLVVSENHKFASKESISICELCLETFILLNSNSTLYNLCKNECCKAGFTPTTAYTNCKLETILELVHEGLGVTLLMRKVVEYFKNPKLKVIPLKDKIINEISLITPKNTTMSKSTEAFVTFIENK
ncbi:MAG: LysR family transcriptional regulator [Clostridium sp.]